jgi:hypothetical protein
LQGETNVSFCCNTAGLDVSELRYLI